MNIRARANHPKAFTLVEVLIACVIVGVLLASYVYCIRWSLATTRMQREGLRATQIIVNHMEGVRLFSWSQITNTALLPNTFTDYYYPAGATGQKGITYTGSVSVTNVALSPASPLYSNSMYQITVSLNWTSYNQGYSRSMNTYQAMNGMQNYVY